MPSALKTTVTELGDSRVRVEVEVPAEEVEARVERKARELAAGLKLPGFRRGKVPAPLLIRRVGREVVLEEAVRDELSSWYSDAIERAGVVPVGDPRLDLGELPAQGKSLEFSIEIGVLPTAELGPYRGLEVGRREPEASEEEIEREIAAMRERLARLHTAERPAAAGDFVVVDYVGALLAQDAPEQPQEGEPAPGEGQPGEAPQQPPAPAAGEPVGEGRDQLIELGAGNLIPGFEEALLGASAGETRTVALRFPDDYANPELAGRESSFEVTVKEVKRKELPALDEDFALDAGFDDLRELREDIASRLRELDERRVEAEFRQAALDAAVAGARVELTPELIDARAREMWERTIHALSHRGITREAYLRIAGRREEQLLEEMRPDAELALRREAVLTAIVQAEGIEPTDAQLEEALSASAEGEELDAPELLERLRSAGRIEEAREDLAARQAIDLLASSAAPIPLARAQAREQLWTPEKASTAESAGGGAGGARSALAPGRLWTPNDPSPDG